MCDAVKIVFIQDGPHAEEAEENQSVEIIALKYPGVVRVSNLRMFCR